jgi:hypothetical protein
MALLDRVKERIETDLSDAELQRLIDEANEEIIARYGPHADSTAPITVSVRGGGRVIDLIRPIDTDEDIVVTEYSTAGFIVGESGTLLGADDYRVRNGGRTLDRLSGGYSTRWGGTVEITYTPVNDGNQRQEVTIKLVALAIEYGPYEKRTVGDVSTDHVDYAKEREKLIGSLNPRKGLLLA